VARKRRQLVLMGPEKAGAPVPLGSRRTLTETLAGFNTGPDGGVPSSSGTEFFYGPGMTVEIATSMEQISQAIVSISDDEIALPVLMKMCKQLSWKLMDIESGRVFG
jgi:hypothetical protein